MVGSARVQAQKGRHVAQSTDQFTRLEGELVSELNPILKQEHEREVEALYEEQVMLREELERIVELIQSEILPREKHMHALIHEMDEAFESSARHMHDQMQTEAQNAGDTRAHHQPQLSQMEGSRQAMEQELARIAKILTHGPVMPEGDWQPQVRHGAQRQPYSSNRSSNRSSNQQQQQPAAATSSNRSSNRSSNQPYSGNQPQPPQQQNRWQAPSRQQPDRPSSRENSPQSALRSCLKQPQERSRQPYQPSSREGSSREGSPQTSVSAEAPWQQAASRYLQKRQQQQQEVQQPSRQGVRPSSREASPPSSPQGFLQQQPPQQQLSSRQGSAYRPLSQQVPWQSSRMESQTSPGHTEPYKPSSREDSPIGMRRLQQQQQRQEQEQPFAQHPQQQERWPTKQTMHGQSRSPSPGDSPLGAPLPPLDRPMPQLPQRQRPREDYTQQQQQATGGLFAERRAQGHSPEGTSQGVFDSLDQNHDGVISREEWNQAVGQGLVRSGAAPLQAQQMQPEHMSGSATSQQPQANRASAGYKQTRFSNYHSIYDIDRNSQAAGGAAAAPAAFGPGASKAGYPMPGGLGASGGGGGLWGSAPGGTGSPYDAEASRSTGTPGTIASGADGSPYMSGSGSSGSPFKGARGGGAPGTIASGFDGGGSPYRAGHGGGFGAY